MPPMKATGMNTAARINAIATTGADTSDMARAVASLGLMPSSIWRCTASTTTMASSTTMPIASTSPNMLVMLIENPSSGKMANVPITATGTVSSGIRGAPVLQENEDHQEDQPDRLHQGHQYVFDGGAHEHGGVVRHHVVDSFGEARLHAVHVLDYLIGGLNRVGARSQIDNHVGRGLAVQPAESAISLRAQFDAADVVDVHQRGVRLRAHHDILELAGIGEAAGRGHRVLEIGAAWRRRLADR